MLLTPVQLKPKSFESRRNFFLPGVDASHVYVRALALGCFHSNISATLRASLSGTFLQTARFGYATEGALFISAQLSSDAVSALQKLWVLIRLWKQLSAQART